MLGLITLSLRLFVLAGTWQRHQTDFQAWVQHTIAKIDRRIAKTPSRSRHNLRQKLLS